MTTVEEAGRAAAGFIKEAAGVSESKVIKLFKDGLGWKVEVEICEDNPFIRSLGLRCNVKDRQIYTVEMDENLSVQSYFRHDKAA